MSTTGVSVSTLAGVPLLAGADADALEALAAEAYPRRVLAGDWVIREGDGADDLFVVLRGRLRAVAGAKGDERTLRVSATPGLAAELEFTDPAVIPPGPVRSMTPVGGSEFSAEFIADLRDRSVRVVLAADPEAARGWFVVSIEPEG